VDFSKLSKTIRIFGVVQLGLIALLVYMAVNFQEKLRMLGRENRFMHGVIAAFIVELLVLYPIYTFAGKEVERDLAISSGNLSKEEMDALAKKKRFSDIIKISAMGFFIIFIMAAPADPFILSIIYYSFVLTILCYLQCYNFAARKLMKGQA